MNRTVSVCRQERLPTDPLHWSWNYIEIQHLQASFLFLLISLIAKLLQNSIFPKVGEDRILTEKRISKHNNFGTYIPSPSQVNVMHHLDSGVLGGTVSCPRAHQMVITMVIHLTKHIPINDTPQAPLSHYNFICLQLIFTQCFLFLNWLNLNI